MVSRLLVMCLIYIIVYGFEYRYRCILFNGKCVSYCPTNMHVYHTRCDGRTWSQRTCDEPLTYILGYTCGWSRCDCNGDLVLDEQTHNCVRLEDCPLLIDRRVKDRFTERRKSDRSKKYHLSKKVRYHESALDGVGL